ncbi:MAG: hypothetical protein CL912_18140 [Deltaproteobacteria bacterium]|nr:hypothetical protein [Deltaproteobacteria bacterium]
MVVAPFRSQITAGRHIQQAKDNTINHNCSEETLAPGLWQNALHVNTTMKPYDARMDSSVEGGHVHTSTSNCLSV